MTGVSDEELTRRYDTVDVYREGAAVKIALNRPERMNAWSSGLSEDLLAVLREVAGDDAVRAVMLTGNGRAFCAGADLKEGADDAVAGQLDTRTVLTRWYHPIVTAIRQMPKPVVTAVNGPAAGAGLSLALAGDLDEQRGSLVQPSHLPHRRSPPDSSVHYSSNVPLNQRTVQPRKRRRRPRSRWV